MKSTPIAALAILLLTGAASPEARPTVDPQLLNAAPAEAQVAPEVVVSPQPTSAQALRAGITLATQELQRDLDAARAATGKDASPAARLAAHRAVEQRKLAFEVRVFELQLEYARALGDTERIKSLTATVKMAEERLQDNQTAARDAEGDR